jgi:hypothetical protein
VVGDVRRQWEADPQTFEAIFAACGAIAAEARAVLDAGSKTDWERF